MKIFRISSFAIALAGISIVAAQPFRVDLQSQEIRGFGMAAVIVGLAGLLIQGILDDRTRKPSNDPDVGGPLWEAIGAALLGAFVVGFLVIGVVAVLAGLIYWFVN